MYSVGTNEKIDFYELWQLHKQLKIMEMSELDLIFTLWDIYRYYNLNTFTEFSSSSKSIKFKDILPWNISQMITKTVPISTRIVISYAMKRGILFWVWQKVNRYWDNNMIRISEWGKSHCRTNTSVRRKKQIQKSRTARTTVRDARRKVNHLSKVVWDS